jgi:hypothetical protein
VGASSVLFVELMYDYIAFAAFFIRLLVQAVRLVLMIIAYSGMHDVVVLNTYNEKSTLQYDTI